MTFPHNQQPQHQQPGNWGPPAPPPPPARPTFGRALLATLVWVPVNFVLAVLVAGMPTARQAGAFVGSMVVPALLAALATWLIARRSTSAWSFGQLVLVSLPFAVLLRFLFAGMSQ
ncbi:hypothetical protein ABZ863_03255 [Saccharomonospora sp. NPDC046836]|uniref:hypothetical protein n=1 Tax=Saccharomonospora sp. NPDC046836 TaxID=3156921 RepID=UPI0033D1AF75